MFVPKEAKQCSAITMQNFILMFWLTTITTHTFKRFDATALFGVLLETTIKIKAPHLKENMRVDATCIPNW